MIYHLYFKSGERAYNLKLYNDQENEQFYDNQLFTNTRGGVELLKLGYKNLKLVSHQNTRNDKKVCLDSIVETDHQLDIYLSDNGKRIKYPQNGQFRFVEDGDSLEIYNQGNETAESFIFVFHYNDQEYLGKFLVDCLPDNDIYEVVLDFGSEASQMLINWENGPQNCRLFNNCARHFFSKDPQKIGKRTYDQQDNDDDELFRSIFFLHQQANQQQDLNRAVIAKPNEQDPLLDFITLRDDDTKGQRLPNIKISYLSGEQPENVDLKKLHQGIVMRFIHEVVMEVKDKRNGQQGKCGIRLYLLVPNVMGQEQLSDFILDIRKYTGSPEFRELLPETMKDVVFDLHSYSESDASFVSWLESDNNRIEEGNYLIIDVGKGTTDFSIIKVEDGRNAFSIYRSGFIGAGNALTYAIFVNYIVTLGGLTKAKSIIEKVLKGAEEADLYRLETILENYKKNENPVINNNNDIKIDETMAIKTIISKIQERGDLSDDLHIIESTIHQIIKKIVVNVQETNFKKVILSGRAFKYQPFRDTAISLLEKYYHMEGNVIALDDKQLKKGCLIGPLRSIQISKQSDMIGIPIAIDVTKRNNEKDRLKKNFENYLSEALGSRDIVPTTNERKTWIKRILEVFRKGRDIYSSNIAESTTRERRGSRTINLQADNDDIRSILRGELNIGSCDENTHFYISDDEYETENHEVLDRHSKYQLFFDGTDFYVKDDRNSIKLKPCIEIHNCDMLYESLFPYPYRILDDDCDIPKINGN